MSLVTTHVLDAATGLPAEGVGVRLLTGDGAEVATGVTDGDGRIAALGPERLAPGHHRLEFAVGPYFAARATPTFFPVVTLDFLVGALDDHLHVPLLLSPFAYSTYRGS
ncbi:hydroxyisourate hydrolase [Propioniciclava soli]|uniref:5-hydroxyisourate hydrolase n=1 Tax=Propioniciclava soli TaxID=2775081 RepID=A0ABZ3CC51_9ACTN|nr:hydroxyisourate hydrolase [Propioniciclava soli]